MPRKFPMPEQDRQKALAAVDAYRSLLLENSIYNVLANASLVATETNGMAKHRCDIDRAHQKLLALIAKLRFELSIWPST